VRAKSPVEKHGHRREPGAVETSHHVRMREHHGTERAEVELPRERAPVDARAATIEQLRRPPEHRVMEKREVVGEGLPEGSAPGSPQDEEQRRRRGPRPGVTPGGRCGRSDLESLRPRARHGAEVLTCPIPRAQSDPEG